MSVVRPDPLVTLDLMIGLAPVKEEIRKIISFRKLQQKRIAVGLPASHIANHIVFTGNPGTGKTTVARVLARAFHQIGVISTENLVEVDRSDLVASYVGQTAAKTKSVLETALDGVLFIDEAYSLAGASDKDYGYEAVDTLLKFMEDNRERLVVIVAGYEEEMKDFIEMNPGLKSRFNRYIHFPDYNADELTRLFLRQCKKNLYDCSEEVVAALYQHMQAVLDSKPKDFSNGRFVRNFFEQVLERQSMRLCDVEDPIREQLREITIADLGKIPEVAYVEMDIAC